MSPEKQRIAIAEICWWKDCHATGGLPCGIAPGETEHRELPDYPNDLNAMHEAEGGLGDARYSVYCDILRSSTIFGERAVSASAGRRSKAFLQAYGKWEDE